MSSTDTGGPAFPVPGLQNDESFNGMSLRDYFAARAMHALLLADGTIYFDNRAKEAYEMADAMLEARSK